MPRSHSVNSRIGLALLAILATAVDARAQCEWEPGFRITRDSIGPLPTRTTFASVKTMCAQARDTVYQGLTAVAVPTSDGGAVIAIKGGSRGVEPGQEPVHVWYVLGDGTLPEGVSMSAPWAELHEAYGTGKGYYEGPPEGVRESASAIFDRYPGMVFDMEGFDPTLLRGPNRFDLDIYLASVPDDATIWRVMVWPPT